MPEQGYEVAWSNLEYQCTSYGGGCRMLADGRAVDRINSPPKGQSVFAEVYESFRGKAMQQRSCAED